MAAADTNSADAQSHVAEALAALRQVTAAVATFAGECADSAKEGELFAKLSEDVRAAEAQLLAVSKSFTTDGSALHMPAEVAVDAVTKALGFTSLVMDHAQEWDDKALATAKLALVVGSSYDTAVQQLRKAKGALQGLRRTVEDSVADAARRAADALAAAREQLERLVAASKTAALGNEGVQRALETLAAARVRVAASVELLSEAPGTEKPGLPALEDVALSRDAVQAVAEAAAAGVDAITDVLAAARDRALGAVDRAAQRLAELQTAIAAHGGLARAAVTVAAGVAHRAAHATVTAAAALDAKYGVGDKALEVAAKLDLQGKAEAGVAAAGAKAAELDAKYGVVAKAKEVASHAKAKATELDASLTGGKGVALAERAVALGVAGAESAVAYAKAMGETYSAAKAEAKEGGEVEEEEA